MWHRKKLPEADGGTVNERELAANISKSSFIKAGKRNNQHIPLCSDHGESLHSLEGLPNLVLGRLACKLILSRTLSSTMPVGVM